MSQSVGGLLQEASSVGDISGGALTVLQNVDIGQQFSGGLGMSVDSVQATELILVTLDVDDSSSMTPNAQAVSDGHNTVIDSLKDTKQADQIMLSTRYINGHLLNNYNLLKSVTRMSPSNFRPSGMTPLYESALATLAGVLAKTQEALNYGCPVRTITLLATDGGNNGPHTAAEVRQVVEDMLKKEYHIIAGMGVSDGHTDFRRVFQEMGIPDYLILTPGDTPHEIREAFATFSKSAVRASQNAGSFSQVALGGFGKNP